MQFTIILKKTAVLKKGDSRLWETNQTPTWDPRICGGGGRSPINGGAVVEA